MKKNGILNSDISRVLSYMGHTDKLCIGDCGLPIPEETERIDLSVRFGQPLFMDVLKEVTSDMKVEKIYLALEMKEKNPEQLKAALDHFESEKPEVVFITHEELKRMEKDCRAVIRTGEVTPYSNIILQSGCLF